MVADVSQYIQVGDLLKILLIGLGAGAGLTAVFSLGILGLSAGGYSRDHDANVAKNPMGLALAVLCFLVVLAGIVFGIYVALHK
jgi:hypothetical protein